MVSIGGSVANIQSFAGLCCGAIGSGNAKTKFCIKSNKHCTVQKHKKHKVDTIKPGYYILDSNVVDVCYTEPHLGLEKASDAIRYDLMHTVRTKEQLVQEFTLLGSQDHIYDVEDKEAVKKEILKAKAYKTPRKGGIPAPTITDRLDMRELLIKFGLGKLEMNEPPVDAKSYSLKTLTEAVNNAWVEIKRVDEFLAELGLRMEIFGDDVEEKYDIIIGAIQQIRQLQGEMGQARDEELESTIWASLSTLKAKGESANLKSSEAVKEARSASKTAKNLSDAIGSVLTSYKERIEMLQTQVESLERSQVKKPAESQSKTFQETYALGSYRYYDQDDSDEIMDGTDDGVVGRLGETVESILTALESAKARIVDLEAYNSNREEQGLSEFIRLLGNTFGDPDYVEIWYTSNGGREDQVPPFGLFVDQLLLLH